MGFNSGFKGLICILLRGWEWAKIPGPKSLWQLQLMPRSQYSWVLSMELLHVTCLAPRIFSWLLQIWKVGTLTVYCVSNLLPTSEKKTIRVHYKDQSFKILYRIRKQWLWDSHSGVTGNLGLQEYNAVSYHMWLVAFKK